MLVDSDLGIINVFDLGERHWHRERGSCQLIKPRVKTSNVFFTLYLFAG